MNPDDEPPDSLETIDDEVVIEKTLKKKTTTFETPNNTPSFSENEETNEQNKNQEKHPNTDVITLKSPVLPEANNAMTQRTSEVATAAVIVNNIITAPVTLQLRPSRGSTNLNVLNVHQNIFSAMKLIDPTLKIITFQNETIDTTDQFPSSTAEYSSKFKDVHKDPKSSRVYISHKSNQQSHLVTSNTETNNNSQASSILW